MNPLVSKLDQNRDKQIKKRFEPIDVSSFNRLKFKFFRLNQLKFLRILSDLPIRYLMENFPSVKRVDVNDRTRIIDWINSLKYEDFDNLFGFLSFQSESESSSDDVALRMEHKKQYKLIGKEQTKGETFGQSQESSESSALYGSETGSEIQRFSFSKRSPEEEISQVSFTH